MKIKIYYGMSGALKGATMTSQKANSILTTLIKPWKHYQYGVFDGKLEENDLYYGVLQLVCLEKFINENKTENTLLVERGVTDPLFYYYMKEGREQDPEFIKSVCEEENKLLDGYDVEKILLIQHDEEFIKNVVLKNEIRKKTFEDCKLSGYLMLQDLYVDFSKKYNNFNDIIEITDAKDYITNKLGLEWINQ